ncbi:MAG: DUF520 family protein [Elusimicrobia bacterium]|nr:DUF520 family protein [Elusimicrobiota bacterium]
MARQDMASDYSFDAVSDVDLNLVSEVVVEFGIPTDKAKKIQQALKDAKLKVNAQIQDAQLRVSSKSKDEIQAAMTTLRAGASGWELDLQFKNFR